ncbi:MAG: peptidoglycan bridge formation glycyltransferase FemA/FemB family protein [Spirochaetales bacterium]|nr:peptidoglycan bridge formation glycyltransferase FemA/FemB family protein [Spirochaetales bacterium]
MSEIKIEKINLIELEAGNNLLQSAFWGELKQAFGWQPFAFIVDSNPLLVLVRELGGGNSLAYIPHGPAGPIQNEIGSNWKLSAMIAEGLKPLLPSSCVFIRFDPPWGISVPALTDGDRSYPENTLSAPGMFRKALMDIQPPSTVVLDIGRTEEELLKGMKTKTRYNIKLAAKKGVTVQTRGVEALKGWYELYRITAERDRIALHSYEYYEKIFNLAAEKNREVAGSGPELRLLEAVIDGTVEAGIIISFQGAAGRRRATYLYGASSNNKRNLMPSYALQWEAIRQAAAAGCSDYDFFGIPPADDPEHPMHGLYRFKTGFGGQILHRPGCWDYPLRKVRYNAFRSAEKLRNYYYKKFRKKFN